MSAHLVCEILLFRSVSLPTCQKITGYECIVHKKSGSGMWLVKARYRFYLNEVTYTEVTCLLRVSNKFVTCSQFIHVTYT